MPEELKPTEGLENEELENEETENETPAQTEDNDADIDQFIRELTSDAGMPQPENKPEKKEEPEEKEPEIEHFRVTSQIGEDDYRAFIYYSTLLRHKWTLPVFILVPILFAFSFTFNEGHFYPGNLILPLAFLYIIIALIVIFRCQRWMSKIKKSSPQTLHLTDTTMIFLTHSVVHIKNGKRTKVNYKHMIDMGESRKHFIMYFDNDKSMVFRKEDMAPEDLSKFGEFIRARVNKKNFVKTLNKSGRFSG